MNFEKITSAQNPKIKHVKRLSHSVKDRKKEGQTILDGFHLIQEACQKGFEDQIEFMVITEKFKGALEFKSLTPVQPVLEIPESLMTTIAPTKSPSGILAVFNIPKTPPIQTPKAIVCIDQIQDPGNLGTILRSCTATGVVNVYCSPGTVEVWSPKVLRAAMGAHFYVHIQENSNLSEALRDFKGNIYGTFMNGNTNLFNTPFEIPSAFVLGNEGQGISKEVEAVCTHKLSIPMHNNFESLNVATSATVCLYEFYRQTGQVD